MTPKRASALTLRPESVLITSAITSATKSTPAVIGRSVASAKATPSKAAWLVASPK